MIHDISLIRLSDGQAVSASAFDIGIDADSWAWTWSATLLGTAARDLVMPSAEGEPVTLQAIIDGYTWHLIVEDIPLDRRHGSNGIRASGRGLSAELSAPDYLPESGYLENARTIQQAMLEQLPLDDSWSLTWDADTPDWLLPAGALTWSEQTPIQILRAAAQGVGLVRPSHRRAQHPRPATLPGGPWNYDASDPTLTLSESVLRSLSYAANRPAQANAVYVHGGESGGILARVVRKGTAGDLLLPVASHECVSSVDAARVLGTRLLAAQQRQPAVLACTLPLGPDIPLATVGDLRAIEMDDGSEIRGIVNSVQISAV